MSNRTGGANSFFGNVAGLANDTGRGNSFFGADAGRSNNHGHGNSFFGTGAGNNSSVGNDNTFIGSSAGWRNLTGSNNTLIGAGANVGLNNLTNATAIGANSVISQSNSLVLGNNADVGIGTSTPLTKLHIEGAGFVESMVRSTNERAILSLDSSAGGQRRVWTLESGIFGTPGLFGIYDRTAGQARLVIGQNGNVGIGTSFLGGSRLTVDGGGITSIGLIRVLTAGVQGNMHLCRSSLGFISFCSSSLRYKTDLRPFTDGLRFINQLRPVSFKWKSDASLDVGFGAEDVAKVNPLFVTYNDKGQVEGVKYDRLSTVFVNAIKEQQ
ncbi:MAG: tail fiber domain-containing protein, partial [Pyrinomonadaceae bacterium]